MRLTDFLRALGANRARRAWLPRFLTYTVTFACNARCIMCDSWKIAPEDELSPGELDGILAQLPQLDAVRLTGGEPFVRADFAELAGVVLRRSRPLALHVTTNGFLTERIVRFCATRPRRTPLHVLVSLDGVEEKHNHVRGRANAWRSATATLTELAVRQREWNLQLGVNQTVVDEDGVEQYRQLRDFLRPLGVDHQFVMAYDVSATYSVERGRNVAPKEVGRFATFGKFAESKLRELCDEVESDLARLPWWKRWAKQYYVRGIRNRLLHGRAEPNPRCVALNAHLRLFPNGDVPTCQFNGQVVGNLRRQSFAEVWRSAGTQAQRQWVAACPGCWAECEVMPSAVYTLDLLRPARG